jgi:hypothetical protein
LQGIRNWVLNEGEGETKSSKRLWRQFISRSHNFLWTNISKKQLVYKQM